MIGRAAVLSGPSNIRKGIIGMREVLAIEAAAVCALRVGGVGPARTVRAYAERPLPPGVLVPSHSIPNIHDEAAFARALGQAIGPGPPGPSRGASRPIGRPGTVLKPAAGGPARRSCIYLWLFSLDALGAFL